MKKLRFWIGVGAILGPMFGCITFGIILGQNMLSNPEMVMLLKVLAYLCAALFIISLVAAILVVFILTIGKGLGLSQGDTKSALQAAIALARSSNAVGRIYNRIPKGLLPGYGSGYQQQPFYQDQVIHGDATDTEQANVPAWEK